MHRCAGVRNSLGNQKKKNCNVADLFAWLDLMYEIIKSNRLYRIGYSVIFPLSCRWMLGTSSLATERLTANLMRSCSLSSCHSHQLMNTSGSSNKLIGEMTILPSWMPECTAKLKKRLVSFCNLQSCMTTISSWVSFSTRWIGLQLGYWGSLAEYNAGMSVFGFGSLSNCSRMVNQTKYHEV